MKKFMMLIAAITVLGVAGPSQAADFQPLPPTEVQVGAQPLPVQSMNVQPYAAPQAAQIAPQAGTTQAVKLPHNTVAQPVPEKAIDLKGGVRLVPDAKQAPVESNKWVKKSDQGYSGAASYNVFNQENKPITQELGKKQKFRIGYKNKNRKPANE